MLRVGWRRSLIAMGVLFAGLASSLAASANGLERFQRQVLPRLKPDSLRYEKATAVGANGFQLEKVVAAVPESNGRPSGSKVRIGRMVVDDLDYDGFAASEARFAAVRLERVEMADIPDLRDILRRYGIGATAADVRVDYRLDTAAQVLTVNRLEIAPSGFGRMVLEAVFERVRSLADLNQLPSSAPLRSAKLTYDDKSGVRQLIRGIGGQSGRTDEAVVRDWLTALAVAAAGKGQQTTAAADALASYVQDYRQPKGSLQISQHPAKPLPLIGAVGMLFSPDPAQALGLAVTYLGTRTNAAASALAR